MSERMKNIWLPVAVLVAYVLAGGLVIRLTGQAVVATSLMDIVIIVIWAVYRLRVRNVPKYKVDVKTRLAFVGLFALILLFGQVAAAWVLETFGSASYETYSNAMGNDAVLSAFLGLLFAPMAEEILLRGVAFGLWRKSMNPYVVLVLQAVVFALLHGTLVHAIPTFCFAMFQGVLYARTNRLTACMATHFLYNGLSAMLGGLVVPAAFGLPYVFGPILGASIGALVYIYQKGLVMSHGKEEEAHD